MKTRILLLLTLVLFGPAVNAVAGDQDDDLAAIRQRGVLRHIGVPYANFCDGEGGGLSTELIQGFASRLGVRYEYVRASWGEIFPFLLGRNIKMTNGEAELLEPTEIRGDLIANGLTILPWRQKLIDYSEPTFPTGVWLIGPADGSIKAIRPSGNLEQDIKTTKALLPGQSVLGIEGTCLAPNLYGLAAPDVEIRLFNGSMNDIAPAVIHDFAKTALLDVPDALLALAKWPAKVTVLGPISELQQMGVGFRKQSTRLRQEFNNYLGELKANGRYKAMMRKYYPGIFDYFPDFLPEQK